MIELNENTLGIWSVSLPVPGDWMGTLQRDGERLKLICRFRWYRDDKTFDSEDEKRWYEVTLGAHWSVSAAIESVRDLVRKMPAKEAHWELIRGERSVEELAQLLLTMPGISHKTLPASPPVADNCEGDKIT